MTALATQRDRAIARPLKVLIPLIQGELQQGDDAGAEHYINAGEMLNEAKAQVAYGRWGTWLTKNFDMNARTANRYMRMATSRHDFRHGVSEVQYTSIRHMTGQRDRERKERSSKQQQEFRRVMRELARDQFLQARQKLDDEIKLHRELAGELVDIGFRALATRLHPDRGGSHDAMARLNRVREELKAIAQQRRFV